MYKNNVPADLRGNSNTFDVSTNSIFDSNNNFRTLNLKYMHYIHRKKVLNSGKLL